MSQGTESPQPGFEKPRFCRKCGAKLGASSNFCSNCGANVVYEASDHPSLQPASKPSSAVLERPVFSGPHPSPQNGRRRGSRLPKAWLVIVAVAVVIVVAVAATVSIGVGSTTSPETYIQQMQKWMNEHSSAMNNSVFGLLMDPADWKNLDRRQLSVLREDNARLHDALAGLRGVKSSREAKASHEALVRAFAKLVKAYDVCLDAAKTNNLIRLGQGWELRVESYSEITDALNALSPFLERPPLDDAKSTSTSLSGTTLGATTTTLEASLALRTGLGEHPIAVWDEGKIMVMSVPGQLDEILVVPEPTPVAWSPDGEEILYIDNARVLENDLAWDLMAVHVKTRTVRKVTDTVSLRSTSGRKNYPGPLEAVFTGVTNYWTGEVYVAMDDQSMAGINMVGVRLADGSVSRRPGEYSDEPSALTVSPKGHGSRSCPRRTSSERTNRAYSPWGLLSPTGHSTRSDGLTPTIQGRKAATSSLLGGGMTALWSVT